MNEHIKSDKVIKLIYKYFDMWETTKIKKTLNEDLLFIEIDLADLETFSYKLVDLLRLYPEDMVSIFNNTIRNFKENSNQNNIKVRFKNLPKVDHLNLNELRQEHIGKLISFKGMLKRKTDILPKTKFIHYLCTNPTCKYAENYLNVPQINTKLKKLKSCLNCKSSVEEVSETITDFQQLVLEEDFEDLTDSNDQPKQKYVEIEDDLTTPLKDTSLIVGSKVEVIGIVKKRNEETQKGKSTIGEIYIEANNILPLQETLINIKITKQDEQDIIELSKKDNLLQLLNSNIAPTIAGRTEQKQAVLYHIVGGSKKKNQRSHIHINIIGNASLGKSQILRRLKQFLPKAVYVSAENASGVGLTGSVMKDELTGQWAVEAGAIAYANKGYFYLDEADKLKKEDITKMNEALEHSTISINKAGIKTQLKADCPIISVANPKGGKFNEDQDYIKQINFDPTYLSRFDLIFILDGKDGDSEQDLVLDRLCGFDSEDFETLDDDLLRKYLMYAKNLNPRISKQLLLKLQNYYKQIAAMAKRKKSIDITYRQFTGLIRMSEARAKLFLRDEVLMEDVKEVIKLMNFTLEKLNISEITSGISNTNRSLAELIPEVIKLLEGKGIKASNENIITQIEEMTTKFNKNKIEKMIEQMIREGELFSPRKNELRIIG